MAIALDVREPYGMDFMLPKLLILMACLTFVLSGCGQSGALYLPPTKDQNNKTNNDH